MMGGSANHWISQSVKGFCLTIWLIQPLNRPISEEILSGDLGLFNSQISQSVKRFCQVMRFIQALDQPVSNEVMSDDRVRLTAGSTYG